MAKANELKTKRQETINRWRKEYEQEVKSCLDEAESFAIKHPYDKKCIIKRKNMTEEFKSALHEACREEGMVAAFGWFGRIEIWFDVDDYVATYML